MDLNNFDKKIKSSLENLEAPFEGSSWELLEKRLNAPFSEEQPASVEPVDLVVKRSLEKLEAAYSSADWSLMSRKLDQIALQKRVRMYKIAEAAIILLLIANVEAFLGGVGEVLKPLTPQAPAAKTPMAAAKSKKSVHYRVAKNLPNSNSGFEQLAQQVVDLIASPFQTVNSQQLADANALSLPQVKTGASVLDGSAFYSNGGPVHFEKLVPLPQHNKPASFAWNNIFEIIPGVSAPSASRAGSGSGWYAASYASLDKNKFSTADFAAKSTGAGGGLAVGFRKGKWGIESGLSYAAQQFNPKKEVEIYAGDPIIGYIGAYVNEVQADVFSVPVKVTRRLAKIGNTSLHATAGISAHVATEKQFAYRTVSYPPASPDPVDPPDPSNYPIPKSNHQGYLEGGNFKNNVYTSADLGVRLEQKIGKRYSAFIEPAYRSALGKGYGPKGEKINNFSIQAGVMAAL